MRRFVIGTAGHIDQWPIVASAVHVMFRSWKMSSSIAAGLGGTNAPCIRERLKIGREHFAGGWRREHRRIGMI